MWKQVFKAVFPPSSEIQGQLVGATESRNGEKDIRRKEVKNEKRSPWSTKISGNFGSKLNETVRPN